MGWDGMGSTRFWGLLYEGSGVPCRVRTGERDAKEGAGGPDSAQTSPGSKDAASPSLCTGRSWYPGGFSLLLPGAPQRLPQLSPCKDPLVAQCVEPSCGWPEDVPKYFCQPSEFCSFAPCRWHGAQETEQMTGKCWGPESAWMWLGVMRPREGQGGWDTTWAD